MKLIKHMEAVFVATVALALSGSYLIDTLPAAHAQSAAVASTGVPAVVVVKAKRMTDAEKQQSLLEERSARLAKRM